MPPRCGTRTRIAAHDENGVSHGSSSEPATTLAGGDHGDHLAGLVEDDEVGPLADLDRADVAVDAEQAGRVERRGTAGDHLVEPRRHGVAVGGIHRQRAAGERAALGQRRHPVADIDVEAAEAIAAVADARPPPSRR